MSWFEERFEQREGRLRFDCLSCGRGMWFPTSKHGKYLTCGAECSSELRQKERDTRKRNCLTCGAVFFPRTGQIAAGIGKYCSQKCNPSHRSMNTPEAQEKARSAWKKTFESGSMNLARGERNPRWKGGPEAAYRRKVEDGRLRNQLRAYRAKNPEKVREWESRRQGRKVGRLPRGTIQKLGSLQRWRCCICRKGIKSKYHVDHIVPLARGGKHEPSNLQLLCPSCNVRKSAKDPIDYMQQVGFLL